MPSLFVEIRSGIASNCHTPDLYLPNRWDYRYGLSHAAEDSFFTVYRISVFGYSF
jgi:hypothetical protein